MILLHTVFLVLISGCNLSIASNTTQIQSSSNPNSTDLIRKTSFSASDQISNFPRTDSFANVGQEIEKQNQSIATSTASQPTGLFTKAYYGIAKLTGKSATAIFHELAKQGTLQADLQSQNPHEATHRLHNAFIERYNGRNPYDPANQRKIYEILTTAESIAKLLEKDFGIDKIAAEMYNQTQYQVLLSIVTDHAEKLQPELERIKQEAIAAAEQEYQQKIAAAEQERQSKTTAAQQEYRQKAEHLLLVAQETSFNSRYLDEQADNQRSQEVSHQDNFVDLQSYEQFLATRRSCIEVAPKSRAH